LIRAETGTRPEEIRQAAEHTLFVEGLADDGFDSGVLLDLLWKTKITIRGLGPSRYVKAAADALHPNHPHYYFLIDRDHNSDEEVEKSWQKFPDPSFSNLLIWRKREIENYFLTPDYFLLSPYANTTKEAYETILCQEAAKQVFLDAANMVITTIREQLKQEWIAHFETIAGFENADAARTRLIQLPNWEAQRKKSEKLLKRDAIEKQFSEHIKNLLDGEPLPKLGKGRWLDLMHGKRLLKIMVSKCTHVTDRNGAVVNGKEKLRQFIRSLMELPFSQQPTDFQSLYNLMKVQTAKTA
jgi:hypothetical protein